jgi:hypothetical protein
VNEHKLLVTDKCASFLRMDLITAYAHWLIRIKIVCLIFVNVLWARTHDVRDHTQPRPTGQLSWSIRRTHRGFDLRLIGKETCGLYSEKAWKHGYSIKYWLVKQKFAWADQHSLAFNVIAGSHKDKQKAEESRTQ